ncbi:hypothetical protein CSA37_07980 [Candidatus Fermentibacteria bacterium]|nr:MAG: hypothetical protein CSA37_07980 [Candidatus Fermentibacteria bacterium]
MPLVMDGFSAEFVLSKKPDFIWLPHTDYTWFRKVLLDFRIFQMEYDYYPGLFNYGVAVRSESESYHLIMEALEQEFAKQYSEKNLNSYLASPSS